MSDKYILVDKEPVLEKDLLKWGQWLEDNNEQRRVAHTTLKYGIRISTVFLGIDHNLSGIGQPILFETMVFDTKDEVLDAERYGTWEEAESGHKRIVAHWRKRDQA